MQKRHSVLAFRLHPNQNLIIGCFITSSSSSSAYLSRTHVQFEISPTPTPIPGPIITRARLQLLIYKVLNMVPRLVRRERRYCLAMCAVVLVLFTVAHWRSYTILTKESNRNTLVRSKLLVKDLKNRKNTSRGLRPGYVAHSVITDAICSVKGVSFSASYHEGINRFNQFKLD